MRAHFGYLARKLDEEIVDGAKTVVYRAERAADTGDLAQQAARAVARRGRAPLLWVMTAAQPERTGRAHWAEPGRLMFGYLDRFAPKFAAAAAAPCACWLTLLENAARLTAKSGRLAKPRDCP